MGPHAQPSYLTINCSNFKALLDNKPANICLASAAVSTDTGDITVNMKMDPCGAASVIDAPLMKNIKSAADYGLPAIRMTTLGGFTPIYKDVGELDFVDDNGNNCIILGYAQYKPLAGHKNFALLC